MRLIDADALMPNAEYKGRYDVVTAYDISNAPTIEPEPHWIPCSERLPDPRIDVWCNSDLGQMVGYYEETLDAWYGRDYLELVVNAWMPLPEPYEERKEQ